MATGTILDMFAPQTAETIGTMRVTAIADQPCDQQIRNAGMSVMDAMLASAKDQVVALATGTAVGQNLIASAQAQQQQAALQKWGPLILIGLIIVGVLIGFGFRRS